MINNLADFSEEELQEKPCGRLEHPEANDGLALNHEDDTSEDLLADYLRQEHDSDTSGSSSAQPSGGTSTTASEGKSTTPSGGTTAAASGGKSTAPSGGKTPSDQLNGGGANSGVSRSML
jgi:hypothetical protein